MQEFALEFQKQRAITSNWFFLLHDIAEVLKINLHVFLYKTSIVLTNESLTSWFTAKDVFLIKHNTIYYYIIVTEIKIIHNMFTLQEILNIINSAKASDILYYESNPNTFYWIKSIFFKQIKNTAIQYSSVHEELITPRNLINLAYDDLFLIFKYFEPIQLIFTKINPACSRIYLENITVDPKQLFKKLVNKTIFIVHKKNNEYCRIGPFIFKDINHFFEKLFTFDNTAEINSDESNTIRTVAYIDIYV